MSFEEELAELGFGLLQERRSGTRQYTRQSNPFLRWWVLVHADGTAELTWEFELGAYLNAKGFSVSAQDELSLLLFPSRESRNPAQPGWMAAEIERTERHLRSIDLVTGT
jgi:hypothetical protein